MMRMATTLSRSLVLFREIMACPKTALTSQL